MRERPAERREPQPTRVRDRRNALHPCAPPTRGAGRGTPIGHEDPAALSRRPNNNFFSVGEETLSGCLTDRRSAAAGRVAPRIHPAADGASCPGPGGGRQPRPHAPNAGGQLQRLVRQPPAPRQETARSAYHLGLALGWPEARRAETA
jgi:hypothetical protein